MLDLTAVAQIAWTSFATSSYFVLFAVAFALVLKVNGVFNFTQAAMMTVAFYAAYSVVALGGMPGWLGLIAALVAPVLLAMLLERFGFRALRERRAQPMFVFIFTLIAAQFVTYLITLVFGTWPTTIFPSIFWPVTLVGDVAVSKWDLPAIAATLVCLAVLWGYLRFSRTGQFMIAVADNPSLAELYGIPKDRIMMLAMVVSALLCGAGMFLYGTRAQVQPAAALELMLFAVAASIMGGIGSIWGAALTAVILGFIQNASILVIPSSWQVFLLFAFLFFAIILFPNGFRLPERKKGLVRRVAPPALEPVASAKSEFLRAVDYLLTIVILIGLFVILAASFDLVIGHGGLVSIAHPIFYAIGAYASAMLAKTTGMPVPIAMVLGALVAVVSSILVAVPSLRVSGDYLLIASMGVQLGLIEAIKNTHALGGAGGLTGIPPFLIQSAGRPAYAAFVVLVAVATVLLVRWLVRGPYGRALSAMRDDELAFATLGRRALWIKVSVFALGSGIAGLAGGLYAHYFRYIEPEQFGILQSSALLTMVVVGGMRSTWGPILGAIVLQALPQAITFLNLPPSVLGPLQGLLFTGLVLVFMFLRPQGLIPAPAIWKPRDEGAAAISSGRGAA